MYIDNVRINNLHLGIHQMILSRRVHFDKTKTLFNLSHHTQKGCLTNLED